MDFFTPEPQIPDPPDDYDPDWEAWVEAVIIDFETSSNGQEGT